MVVGRGGDGGVVVAMESDWRSLMAVVHGDGTVTDGCFDGVKEREI